MDPEELYERRYTTILEYVSIFNALEDMDNDNPCKMGIHDGKLYSCWNFGQGIQRNFYGQSRKTFIDFVENTILNLETIVNICISGYGQLDTKLMHKYSALFLWIQSKIFLWMEKIDAISTFYTKDKCTISRFSVVLKLCNDLMFKLDDFVTVPEVI